MNRKFILAGTAVAAITLFAWAQETPKAMSATYASLADAILAVKRTEKELVGAILDGHRHGAEAYCKAGDFEHAAAEIALFANEGDNAVGGVRNRLLEGGHHHNAEGEAQGLYEPGYVTVTKKAKQQCLAASVAMRQAKDEAARTAALQQFLAAAKEVLPTK